ncbi:MAG: chemotaxis response regulator protein-glutamate methylesterase [Clostridiaceae bacterium]|nr:chemotaxis response regulator protein-glutamate methylesterase [Clostridiaceae bacterium]
MPDNIRVLVVDDSILYREALSKGMSADPRIEVVETAGDPFDARDKIIKYRPDVMTCDVEMPRMNGIEFIRRLLPQYPIPVIVVSSVNRAVFDAMKAGAVDFVAKPDVNSTDSVKFFITEMIEKVKIASMAKVMLSKAEEKVTGIRNNVRESGKCIIAIGASTGGTEAINSIIKGLPESTPGIVLVQHIPPVFSKMFAERLNAFSALNVKEAVTGDLIKPGQVLVAPGDKHMKVVKIGDSYKVHCFTGEKVNGHRPSADVLFESVAKEAGGNSIGVILTGMGYDGAKGLLSMRRAGARTIGQDEQSCVVYCMPKVAYNIGAVEKQVSLKDIARLIYKLTG